jgi:hypothetical protein
MMQTYFKQAALKNEKPMEEPGSARLDRSARQNKAGLAENDR